MTVVVYNGVCSWCGGPAYHGFTSQECERCGHDGERFRPFEADLVVEACMSSDYPEPFFLAKHPEHGEATGPTREHAIAALRARPRPAAKKYVEVDGGPTGKMYLSHDAFSGKLYLSHDAFSGKTEVNGKAVEPSPVVLRSPWGNFELRPDPLVAPGMAYVLQELQQDVFEIDRLVQEQRRRVREDNPYRLSLGRAGDLIDAPPALVHPADYVSLMEAVAGGGEE
jgi:hypothetical protein